MTAAVYRGSRTLVGATRAVGASRAREFPSRDITPSRSSVGGLGRGLPERSEAGASSAWGDASRSARLVRLSTRPSPGDDLSRLIDGAEDAHGPDRNRTIQLRGHPEFDRNRGTPAQEPSARRGQSLQGGPDPWMRDHQAGAEPGAMAELVARHLAQPCDGHVSQPRPKPLPPDGGTRGPVPPLPGRVGDPVSPRCGASLRLHLRAMGGIEAGAAELGEGRRPRTGDPRRFLSLPQRRAALAAHPVAAHPSPAVPTPPESPIGAVEGLPRGRDGR
jgi:hypothetical protein